MEAELERKLRLLLSPSEYGDVTKYTVAEDGSVHVTCRPYYAVDSTTYREWIEKTSGIRPATTVNVHWDANMSGVERDIEFYVDKIIVDGLTMGRASNKTLASMIFEGTTYGVLPPIPMTEDLKRYCGGRLPEIYTNWKKNATDSKQFYKDCRKNKNTSVYKRKTPKRFSSKTFMYDAFPETQMLAKHLGKRGKHGFGPLSEYVKDIFKNGYVPSPAEAVGIPVAGSYLDLLYNDELPDTNQVCDPSIDTAIASTENETTNPPVDTVMVSADNGASEKIDWVAFQQVLNELKEEENDADESFDISEFLIMETS